MYCKRGVYYNSMWVCSCMPTNKVGQLSNSFHKVNLYLSGQSSAWLRTNTFPIQDDDMTVLTHCADTIYSVCHVFSILHSLIYGCVCVCFPSRDCGMLLDETPLFEPSLLQELDWSSNTVPFSPHISPSSPGEGLVLRPLHMADFNRGELETGWTAYYSCCCIFDRMWR